MCTELKKYKFCVYRQKRDGLFFPTTLLFYVMIYNFWETFFHTDYEGLVIIKMLKRWLPEVICVFENVNVRLTGKLNVTRKFLEVRTEILLYEQGHTKKLWQFLGVHFLYSTESIPSKNKLSYWVLRPVFFHK